MPKQKIDFKKGSKVQAKPTSRKAPGPPQDDAMEGIDKFLSDQQTGIMMEDPGRQRAGTREIQEPQEGFEDKDNAEEIRLNMSVLLNRPVSKEEAADAMEDAAAKGPMSAGEFMGFQDQFLSQREDTELPFTKPQVGDVDVPMGAKAPTLEGSLGNIKQMRGPAASSTKTEQEPSVKPETPQQVGDGGSAFLSGLLRVGLELGVPTAIGLADTEAGAIASKAGVDRRLKEGETQAKFQLKNQDRLLQMDTAQNKELSKTIKEYNKDDSVKKLVSVKAAVKNARDIITATKGQKIARKSISTLLGRIVNGVGVLSDRDVGAFEGFGDLVDKIERTYVGLTEGVYDPGDVKEIVDFLNTMSGTAETNLNHRAEVISSQKSHVTGLTPEELKEILFGKQKEIFEQEAEALSKLKFGDFKISENLKQRLKVLGKDYSFVKKTAEKNNMTFEGALIALEKRKGKGK